MKLISLMLIPAVLAGQNAQLSDAARKLLRKPRLGPVQLMRPDGRKQDGNILRVTDQFATFQTYPTCENVELSKVAALRWPPTPDGVWDRIGYVALIGAGVAIIAPSYTVYVIADPFRRMAPPLKPPRGEWVSGPSNLMFGDSTVSYNGVTVRRGRYSVDKNILHLKLDGGTETALLFRFDCASLELAGKLHSASAANRATAPIVGDWHAPGYELNLRQDASFEERTTEYREGKFERTAAGLKIHWSDGQDWVAQINHRHIVVTVGGVTTTYHYVPDPQDWGI